MAYWICLYGSLWPNFSCGSCSPIITVNHLRWIWQIIIFFHSYKYQTFRKRTLTSKHLLLQLPSNVMVKELLIVKIPIFCWKSEWDCGWDAPCAQGGKICAPAHTKGRSWCWGTNSPQGWMEPTGWFAVTDCHWGLVWALQSWLMSISLAVSISLASVSPVLAGGTCQAAEGVPPILEWCNFLCPWGKVLPVSCLPVNRYGVSQL